MAVLCLMAKKFAKTGRRNGQTVVKCLYVGKWPEKGVFAVPERVVKRRITDFLHDGINSAKEEN